MRCCCRSSNARSIDSERPLYLLMWVGGLSDSWWAHEEPRRDSRPETWTRLRQSVFIAGREIINCDQSGDCTQTQQLCWIRTKLCCFYSLFLCDVSLKCVCHAALCCCSPVALSTAEDLCHTHIPLSAAHVDLTPNTALLNPHRTSRLNTAQGDYPFHCIDSDEKRELNWAEWWYYCLL